MPRSAGPADLPEGPAAEPPERGPFLTAGEEGPTALAGARDEEAPPRGLRLEDDKDREAGMFFGAARSPDLADRTLLASRAWGPARFRAGRTAGCWALRATLLIRPSSLWPS